MEWALTSGCRSRHLTLSLFAGGEMKIINANNTVMARSIFSECLTQAIRQRRIYRLLRGRFTSAFKLPSLSGIIKYFQPNMNNVAAWPAHREAVRGLSFSPDDTRFVSASDDSKLKLWSFEDMREERTFTGSFCRRLLQARD